MKIDLQSVAGNRFSFAKELWAASNFLRLAVFAGATWAIFVAHPSAYLPHLLFLISVGAELIQWQSDRIKGDAEALQRKVDLKNSFGWPISEADKRDIYLAVSPAMARKIQNSAPRGEVYFTSTEPPGPKKAAQNLEESAWYTREQARIMIAVCAVLGGLVVLSAMMGFLVASEEVQELSTRRSVNRFITSWLLVIFAVGIFKSGVGYVRLFRRADKSHDAAHNLLKALKVGELDAARQWNEYHIGRASAPLLPDWLWNLFGSRLNTSWDRARDAD